MAATNDLTARCGAPLAEGSVRATHPDHVTCDACIETYLASDDEDHAPGPRGSLTSIPKNRRAVYVLGIVGVVVAGLALWDTLSGNPDDDAINAVKQRLNACGLANVLDVPAAHATGHITDAGWNETVIAVPFQTMTPGDTSTMHIEAYHDANGWIINSDMPDGAYSCWGDGSLLNK
jgi:hypothetical protein